MHDSTTGRRPRVGSLFSGYGGLDLAVEQHFDAETIWFSEINEPVARVFSDHWPAVPNLGDITAINWTTVPQVDIICGGFPCQDVSTVGKQAQLAPGTRSGLWANLATAIEALQPDWVVIENVRRLLSAPATRPAMQGATNDERNSANVTIGAATFREVEFDPWGLGNEPAGSRRALAIAHHEYVVCTQLERSASRFRRWCRSKVLRFVCVLSQGRNASPNYGDGTLRMLEYCLGH